MVCTLRIFADGDGFSIGEYREGELVEREAYNFVPYATREIAQQELDEFCNGCNERAQAEGYADAGMVRQKNGEWLCGC